ncbi:MAG: AsmA-like C-terminal region-containing protein [Saprospiraceae bacterium]
MKRFLKRFAIISLIVLIGLVGIAALLASIYEKKIGERIIKEINKQITSDLRVNAFDLSVVSSFPNVAANLNGVSLTDNRDGLLLEAEQLSFRMGLLSLLSSKINVKSVVISDGALQVAIDQKGRPNYDIFKTSEEGNTSEETTDDDEGPTIALAEARLEDIDLIYVDESARQEMMANVQEARFSGEFSSEQFALDSDAKLEFRFVEMDGQRYLAGKNLAYDAVVDVDMTNGKYQFKEVMLDVESNVFRIDGSIEENDAGYYYDLFLNSEKSSLASMIQLLPREYLESLGEFDSKGDFIVKAEVKGQADDRKGPEIRAELSLEDGRLTSPLMDGTLKDVSFLATFSNGEARTNGSSVFEIKNMKGYFDRELMEMRLRVEDLDDPFIDFQLDGVVPVEMVYGFIPDERVKNGDGEIEIRNLQVKGKYDDMIQTSRIARVQTGGELEFDDASLTIAGEEMTIDKGRLQLQDNVLSIEGLKLEGAGSEMEFTGTAQNLLPVLFADSLNSKKAELNFQAKLFAKSLDLDRLVALSLVDEGEEVEEDVPVDSLKEQRIQNRERITNFLKGTFDAQVEEFNYNKIEGENFIGLLDFRNNQLNITGRTQAMEGSFDVQGELYFQDQPYLEARLSCNGINVHEFFREGENFGQDVLRAENVDGTLDAKIAIYVYWDEQGNLLWDKLKILAGLGIKNGKLQDFEMLESFSSFVDVRDLRDIHFTSMENFVEISKQRVIIPVMFIQSNALNLTISGEHSFDQDIAYSLKVNAGQVLANKFKKHDPELKPKKARRNGFFNLYYYILGNIDDYEMKSAKRQVKEDFEQSERRKRAIQHELEVAFNTVIEMVDEPQDWRDIPEYGDDDDADAEPIFLDWEKGGK